MMITNKIRAEILSKTLPYIRKYDGKIVVIKYGGNAMINDELKHAVMSDIVLLSSVGMKVVVVHGGGPEINETLTKMGKKSKFIDGLRVTDQETMDVVQMVLTGKINKNLVNKIELSGGKAIGLSGIDGHMIQAKQLDKKLGYVGSVTKINTTPIINALNDGVIPVISTVGCDKEGQIYNINADTAASRIAGALKAESFLLMTDTRGLLRNKDDVDTLIPMVYVSDIKELVVENVISGGMIPKVQCCVDAIRRGVNRVFIIDGRVPHSIIIEILTDEGIGTMFVAR